jgi:hypothetical protein
MRQYNIKYNNVKKLIEYLKNTDTNNVKKTNANYMRNTEKK